MSKKFLTAALAFFLALPVAGAFAQTGRVTGAVTDSTTGDAVPGANVLVVGTQIGASTDANGAYDLANVPAGSQTLEVSFVGYRSKRVAVDVQADAATTRDIQIASSAVALKDVVVTALGVEREQRSLSYKVDEVKGEDLDRAASSNFVSNLSGKISGARINSSSGLGGSSRIVLRGDNSITGNNQPLIVIDGVPIDNSNFTDITQERGGGGYDYGNAASVINPSDVQSISVLKGASAAALYGSRASNGVIEVTTKSGEGGRQGVGVTVQSSLMFSDIYGFADYQNRYGGGSFAPFATNAEGQLIPDYGTDQSWGPPLDGRMVREWFSYDDVNDMLGKTTPWDAHPGNVENVFETGTSWKTDVAFSQGGDNYNYRASLHNISQNGTSPGSQLGRKTVSFKGSLDLTDRLTSSVSANYINQDSEKRLGGGYSGAVSPWQQFNTFGQRQIDLSEDAPMQDLQRPDGSQRGWNWANLANAKAGNLIYANNPFWTIRRNYPTDDKQRVYGRISLSYDLPYDLTLSGNLRSDYYNDRREERIAVHSVEQPTYSENLYEVSETNVTGELRYDGDLSPDVSLSALGGINYRYSNESRNLGSTAGGLSVAGLYTLENSVARPSITDYYQERGLLGLYASATVGYRDLLYVDGTLRNDWSSTLPDDNNSYLYPSIGASFVFSSLPSLQEQDVLSYGKVRLSYARVGSDTDPYQLAFTYPGGTPFNGTSLQSLPNSLPNPELKPQIKSSYEVGTQLQFFNNRIGVDATYYSSKTKNQILSVGRSGASGFTGQQLNAGTIANQGVELSLNLTPVLSDDFRWDLTVNWAKNENEVEKLPEGRVTIPGGIPPFGPSVVAEEGEPLGTLFGNGFVYDANGNKVLAPNGSYKLQGGKNLGSYQPDWTGGLQTTLSYKGVTVSGLIDGQMGGQIWSLSNLFGLGSGLFQETVEDDIRELGLVPEGVWFPQNADDNDDNDVDPTTSEGQEWTARVPAISFFSNIFGNHEANVYDATYLKLRELSVGYTLPGQWLSSVPGLRGLTVSLVGRNLATLYKETPNFDPTAVIVSSGNAQGFEQGQLPPTRSYGFRLRLSF